MTIRKRRTMTAKECADLIKKRFKLTDIIMVHNEKEEPPYDDGWATDTAGYIIKTLNDPEVFSDDAKYYFTVGLVKINNYSDF